MNRFIFVTILSAALGCSGRKQELSPDKTEFQHLVLKGFNTRDYTYLSRQDSCYVNSYISNYWEETPLDVPRIFNKELLLINYTVKPVNFSFCVIKDKSDQSLSYIGLTDIYTLRHKSKNDSVPTISNFENLSLENILNENSALSGDAQNPNDRDFLMALIYSIYFERLKFVTRPSFKGEADIRELKNRFDPDQKWFDKNDESYIAFEVEYFGFVVFEIEWNDSKISLSEFLISTNRAHQLVYDVSPEMIGCP